MHYPASTIILKRLIREISNNQNAKELISHSESLRAMERVIFCQIEASEGKTFYSTKKKNNLSKHTYNTNNCGGGEGGGYRGVQTSHLSYSVHELCIPRSSLIFLGFFPLALSQWQNMKHCCIISPYFYSPRPCTFLFCLPHHSCPLFSWAHTSLSSPAQVITFVLENRYIEFLLITILLYISMVFYTIEKYFTRYPNISNAALRKHSCLCLILCQ